MGSRNIIPIGEVAAILNNQFLLVQSKEALFLDEELTIFSQISSAELEKQLGIHEIYFPKCEITVIASQGNNIYLVSLTTKKQTKTITHKLPTIMAGLTGLSGLLQKESTIEAVESKEKIGVDQKSNFQLKMDRIVCVGDKVARGRH